MQRRTRQEQPTVLIRESLRNPGAGATIAQGLVYGFIAARNAAG